MGWQLIQSQSLSASAASVTFSNIPQTYKSIAVLISARRDSSSGSGAINAQFNGVTTGYSSRVLWGNGTTANSSTDTVWRIGSCGNSSDVANTFCSSLNVIPNYASTSVNKIGYLDDSAENNATTGFETMQANLWSNTAAITSIAMTNPGGGNFVFGSTFTLYGLL